MFINFLSFFLNILVVINFTKKMNISKRGQVGIEYIIVLGFVTFAIISILIIASFYSEMSRDQIRVTQAESFAKRLISSAESVFYAGPPSRATVLAYLPEGITEIYISSNDIIISMGTSSGNVKMAFSSNVPISGSISTSPGLKKIKLEAGSETVLLSPS